MSWTDPPICLDSDSESEDLTTTEEYEPMFDDDEIIPET